MWFIKKIITNIKSSQVPEYFMSPKNTQEDKVTFTL